MAFEPPRLEKLDSQPELQKLLLGLVKGGGTPSFLWVGPEGSGKRTHALALVRSLFCTRGPDCQGCPACRQVLAKTHPDLYWVDRDHVWAKDEKEKKRTETTVDVVRNLSEKLSRAPFSAPLKVAVIPDADDMNPFAQDSFLKTLEEPPASTLILLLAEGLGSFLPTVQSRCRVLRFPALPDGRLQSILTGTYGWGLDQAQQAVREAAGNLTRALRSVDPDWVEFRRKVGADLDRAVLGKEMDWLGVSQEYDRWEPEVLGERELTATQRKAELGRLALQVYLGLWTARRDGKEPLPKGFAPNAADLVLPCTRAHQDLLSTNLGLKVVLDRYFLTLRETLKKGEWVEKSLAATALGL